MISSQETVNTPLNRDCNKHFVQKNSGSETKWIFELSIVMPCLNEIQTLPLCIKKARQFFKQHSISGEIIVADNGSTDSSREMAQSMGVVVVPVKERGYGAALAGGIAKARGKYIIMGDCDDSYDFTALMPFLHKLKEGYDLVIGNRFQGGIQSGAMPTLHRYFGNPLLTWLGRLFFKSPCGDFYCGLRGFSKESYKKMAPWSNGMEFALEMVIRATAFGLRIGEVPTTLSQDGRDRPPHLRTWTDGFRSLRLYLLYSPKWLFWYPAITLMIIGLVVGAWLLPAPRTIGPVTLDVHTLAYCAAAIVIGFQSAIFALLAKVWAVRAGMHPPDVKFEQLLERIRLKFGVSIGIILGLVGLCGSLYAFQNWSGHAFGDLDPLHTMRIVIPSALAGTLGCQLVFFSFYFSLVSTRNQG